MKKIFTLISISLLLGLCAPLAAKNVVNIIATSNSCNSGFTAHLVQALVHIEKEKPDKLKTLSKTFGRAYRYRDKYLILDDEQSIDLGKALSSIKNAKHSIKTINTMNMLEDSNSTLFLPHDIPKELLVLLKKEFNKKDESIRRGKVRLIGGEQQTLFLDNNNYLMLRRPDWTNIQNDNWTVRFYVAYTIQFNKKILKFYEIPKEFGSLERTIPAIKEVSSTLSNTVIVNTGNSFTCDKTYPLKSLTDAYNAGMHFYAVGTNDLVAKKKLIDPYLEQNKDKPHMEFISANIFRKEGKHKELLFKPYVVTKVGNLKIALLGFTDPKANNTIKRIRLSDPSLSNVEVEDPAKALTYELIKDLEEKVDLIILVTNIDSDDLGKLQSGNNVDIIINGSWDFVATSGEKHIVKLVDYKNRSPMSPFFIVSSPWSAMTHINIEESLGNLNIEENKILLDISKSTENSKTYTDSSFNTMVDKTDIVFPDNASLYPNDEKRVTIDKENFANVASESIRMSTKAELGLFNVQVQSHVKIGTINSSIVRTWIRSDENLVVLRLPGTAVMEMKAQLKNLSENDKLAVAGFDQNGGINGMSIVPNEIYTVATSSQISERPEIYPFVDKAVKKIELFNGSIVSLQDVVINGIKDSKFTNSELKDLYEGKPEKPYGQWTFNVNDVSLKYSAMNQVNSDDFPNVIDSRVRASSQSMLGAKIWGSAVYHNYPFTWDTGVKTDYFQTKIHDVSTDADIANILTDTASFYTNLGFPWIRVGGMPALLSNMGPYMQEEYRTEFSPSPGKPRDRALISSVGWKIYDGSVIKFLSLGAIANSILTTGLATTKLGIESNGLFSYSFLNNRFFWQTDTYLQYLFPETSDNNSELHFQLSLNNTFQVKIYDLLSIGPFVNYFVYRNRVVGRTGTASTIGISVMLSGQWKKIL